MDKFFIFMVVMAVGCIALGVLAAVVDSRWVTGLIDALREDIKEMRR